MIDYSESDFIAWQAERERHLVEIGRLRDAITAAIKEAKLPHYGDKYTQLDNYGDAVLILEKALEGS